MDPQMFAYFTLFLIFLAVDISLSTVVSEHRYGSKKYTVVLNKKTNQQSAEKICQNDYGSTLAKVLDTATLRLLNGQLDSLTIYNPASPHTTHEIWVWGKVNVEHHSYVNLEDGIIPQENGDRCIVMSDYVDPQYPQHPKPEKYNMYSKNCVDNSEKTFICETTIASPSKYIFGQTPGHCPTGTKITSGFVLMNMDGCKDFGGGNHTSVRFVDNIGQCQLDWCGANSTDDIHGIVVARTGHCPGSPSVRGLLSLMSSDVCDQAGSVEIGNVSHCIVEWCWKRESADQLTYSFSTSGTCETDKKITPAESTMVLPQGICKDITAQEGHTIISKNQLPIKTCRVELCSIGNRTKDCKTTEMGKEYTGTLAKTLSGKRCQRWDSNFPHNHGNQNPSWFPDETLHDAANFCRNPADWIEGPFCFTTDLSVEWELCDIPFCEGKAPDVTEIQIGINRYIFIPGQHSSPWEYCQKKYNSRGAIFETDTELEQLSQWLNDLMKKNINLLGEVWSAGKAPLTAVRGEVIKDRDSIVPQGNSGHCVMLSNWNYITNTYSSKQFDLYASDCPQYYRQFLCESTEFKIENYQVDGGVPQMGIHDMETCNLKCTDGCRAVGYHTLEETCWHYFGSEDCKPGRPQWGFIHIQREPCNCHKYLVMMDDDVKLEASSLAPGTHTIVANTPDRAKLNAYNEATPEGILLGAWVPAVMDENQWIQARFPQRRLVYGVITRGLNSSEFGMVKSFTVNYTISPECNDWLTFMNKSDGVKVFSTAHVNPNMEITNIFHQAVFAQCIRILPKQWDSQISLSFDVLGCFEKYNIALGKPASSLEDHKSARGPSLAVDGYTHSTMTWNSCLSSMHTNNPWLIIDLIDRYLVDEVHIYSQRRCCENQLRKLSVRMHMQVDNINKYSSEQECGFISGTVAPGSMLTVKCASKLGRYVVIQKLSKNDSLELCEVKVYGQVSEVQNVALNKPASQSSLSLGQNSGNHHAYVANDGKLNAKIDQFSSTRREKDPWWMVDLQNEHTIYEVSLTSQLECCDDTLKFDVYVHVGNDLEKGENNGHYFKEKHLCAVESNMGRQEMRYVTCITSLSGRYVQVSIDAESVSLNLYEVQVFGHTAYPRVYGGNTTASHCKLPFTYNGTSHFDCITTEDRTNYWCSTTSNYEIDLQWGYCIDAKLVEGRDINEGRVRIKSRNREWGTVCDDDWDDTDASVVCKQLGFSGGKAKYHPFFGQGSGTIFMGGLKCIGNESSLFNCQYTNLPSYCTHHEDAGVVCSATDRTVKVGYPKIRRSQRDTLKEGIIIMPLSQQINVPGKIIAWEFYSTRQNCSLHLQIWRRLYDLKGLRFMMVSQVTATEAVDKDGPVRIISPNEIKVQPGDLIGFSFKNGNPISLDNTFKCDKNDKIIYKTKYEVTAGSIHGFPTKDNPFVTCRVYSLFAEIEVEKTSHLHEFVYHGGLYRIYTSNRALSTAHHLCKTYMGEDAFLYHVENAAEFQFTKQILEEMDIKGSFWVKNRLEDSAFIEQWAPCQPEKGKNCLVFSNDNTDGTFQWYSKSCNDKNYFICENKTEEYSTEKHMYTTPSNRKEVGKKGHHFFSDWRILLAFVLVIAFVTLMTALLIVFIRYKRKRWGYSSRLLSSESTTPLDTSVVEQEEDDDGLAIKSDHHTGSVTVSNFNGKDSQNNEMSCEIENPMFNSQC